jgi:hypothetical protein
VLAVARGLGCVEAWVLTDRENTAAIRLYTVAGSTEAPSDHAMFTFRLDGGVSGAAWSDAAATEAEPPATYERGQGRRISSITNRPHESRAFLLQWPVRVGRLLNLVFDDRGDAVPAQREIRADFDRETIVIYQAYAPVIADAALKAQRFVSTFSFQRMTWIKPSFLWLMHRSNWGQKSGQERILAVRIKRAGWDKALSLAVSTFFEPSVFCSAQEWQEEFARALVHVQRDPERSLRGAGLSYYSIQVGLSRHIIREYVEEWITSIEDLTARVKKIYGLLQGGKADKVKCHLPPERVYPVNPEIAGRVRIEV